MKMAELTVKVCAGTTCHLLGNQAVMDALENISASLGQRLEISYTSCLGGCKEGPCVTIGDRKIHHASPEKVLSAIKEELASEN